jgi:hypothetical protein
MAVAFDALGPSGTGQIAGINPPGVALTWSHTCTGTNLLLVVGVNCTVNPDTGLSTTATYNAVSMTSLGVVHSGGSTSGYVQFFYLINPASGANNVVVTAAGSTGGSVDYGGGSISFTGVHQTTPLGSPFTNTANGTSVSVNVTGTTAGNMVVDTACAGTSMTSVGGSQTQRVHANTGSGAAANQLGMSTAAAGGTVTMTWNGGADFWGIIAAEVLAAGGAAVTATSSPLFALAGPGAVGTPLAFQWQQLHGVDPSGGLFTASLSGSVTPTGAIAKQANKALAGSSTATGTPAKQAQKPLAGSSTSSGALAKQAQKAFAGSVTPSGVLTAIKVVLRSFAGSVTATGALVKQVAKALAGSTSPSGSLAKQDAKAFAGSATPAGALAKQAQKALAGSSTATGALTTVRVILRSYAGTVTAAGALVRQAQKALSGSSTASGTITRQTAKGLAGTVTASGALAKLVRKAYAGTLTAVGTLTTQLAGAQLPAAEKAKRTWRIDNRRTAAADNRRIWRIDNRRTWKED